MVEKAEIEAIKLMLLLMLRNPWGGVIAKLADDTPDVVVLKTVSDPYKVLLVKTCSVTEAEPDPATTCPVNNIFAAEIRFREFVTLTSYPRPRLNEALLATKGPLN